MKKFKIFWNFDAEEKYLHDMAKQGHILKKYSALGVYHFEDGIPQELNYKVDYRLFKSNQEFDSYINLFADAGWKHVHGTKFNGSQYFLPLNEQAGTYIFSDKASAASRYKTLYKICTLNVVAFACYLTSVLVSTGGNILNLGFLTPGLWERTGAAFWSGFFFELPLALFRILPLIFFATMAVFCGYWAVKSRKSYMAQME